MMPNAFLRTGIFVGLASVFATVAFGGHFQKPELKVGEKAPAFSTVDASGKSHTVASLTKSKPVILYFNKDGCPVNKKALPYMQKIAQTYGAGANIVGVYNGDAKRAKEWTTKFKLTFPMLADPEYKIIDSYRIPYSPFVVVIGKDGKIAKIFPGASPTDLPQINQLAATNAGKKAITMDFKNAPEGGGCSY